MPGTPGARKTLKLQAVRIVEPSAMTIAWVSKKRNIPKYKIKKAITCPVIEVEPDAISNPDKLAFIIRNNYGFGTFTIMFWNKYQKNKKFYAGFRCNKKNCNYYKANKCKIRWKTHSKTKSKSCRANRIIRANWAKRYNLTIQEAGQDAVYEDVDFSYKVNYNQMYLFWFWRKN